MSAGGRSHPVGPAAQRGRPGQPDHRHQQNGTRFPRCLRTARESVALSPDTDTIPHNINGVYQPRAYEYCAGYQHKDSTIVGFSHTHFSGTGHSDLGDILIMPTTGALKLNPGTATDPDAGYRSRFSHDTEIATPGYYEVMLDDYGVKAR